MKTLLLYLTAVSLLFLFVLPVSVISQESSWEKNIFYFVSKSTRSATAYEILLWKDLYYEKVELIPGELVFYWPHLENLNPLYQSLLPEMKSEYHEGGIKALEIYKQLFSLSPSGTCKVRIVELINQIEYEEGEKPETLWDYHGGLAQPKNTPPEDLIIYIPVELPVPWEAEGIAVAHEIAHLFQYFMTGSSKHPATLKLPEERSAWICEGGAQYMASLVYPEPEHFEDFQHEYEDFAESPELGLWGDLEGLDGRDYTAYPFFRWIEETYGQNMALDIIQSRYQGLSPHNIIDFFQIDDMWFDYIRKAWGDERYAGANGPLIKNREFELTEENHQEKFKLDTLVPYAAEYFRFTTTEDPPLVYRLHMEDIFGEAAPPNIKDLLKVGAMVKLDEDTWKDVDITDRTFVQFVQGNGQDTDNTIYHDGSEVVIVVTITGDLSRVKQYISEIKEREFGVSIGLGTVWQLGQVRITENPGEEPKKINVIGLVTLMALPHESGMRLHQKTKHFWPNFEDGYYQEFLNTQPEGEAPFKSGKTMERFVEDSCKFWGRQIFDIVDVGGHKDQFVDPTRWDQKLTYHLKPAETPILPGTPHRFTCVPNVATSKGMLLGLFGGGATAAANAVQLAKWINKVWIKGYGDDSYVRQLEDMFVNILTFGFGEDGNGREACSIPDHSGCGEVAVKFVKMSQDNYLVVEVNDKLSLIYKQVKR